MSKTQLVSVAEFLAIVNINITSTAQLISELVKAALATAVKTRDYDPGQVLQIVISADANITLTDPNTGMTLTVASGVEKRIPSMDAMQLAVSTAATATGTVEIYTQADAAL